MRPTPTLIQSKRELNFAHNLESAGWIIARTRRPELASIEFWEYKGKACFRCQFTSELGEKFDYKEFQQVMEEQPAVYRETVATGLAKFTAYLNQLLEDRKNALALDIKMKQESQKNIPALNTETEAANV